MLGMVILHDRRFAHAPVSRGSWDRLYFRDFRVEVPLNGAGARLALYCLALRGTSHLYSRCIEYQCGSDYLKWMEGRRCSSEVAGRHQ